MTDQKKSPRLMRYFDDSGKLKIMTQNIPANPFSPVADISDFYGDRRQFNDLQAAMSAKDIQDYTQVPQSMYIDWCALIKLNNKPNCPQFHMLSREKEKEIREHIQNYVKANY